jgi:uracil-DNA glycosylase
VICTLGNFATKLLTRSQRGITGVHGRPQVHELGARTVRVFPIYHPAAALRSTKTLDELREDFAKLPALLDEPAPVPIGAIAPVAAAVAAAEPEPEPPQMDLFGG